jgi:hypothetical protein
VGAKASPNGLPRSILKPGLPAIISSRPMATINEARVLSQPRMLLWRFPLIVVDHAFGSRTGSPALRSRSRCAKRRQPVSTVAKNAHAMLSTGI